MTRAQRRAHMIVWLVLGPLLLAALAWSIVDRADVPPAPAVEVPR